MELMEQKQSNLENGQKYQWACLFQKKSMIPVSSYSLIVQKSHICEPVFKLCCPLLFLVYIKNYTCYLCLSSCCFMWQNLKVPIFLMTPVDIDMMSPDRIPIFFFLRIQDIHTNKYHQLNVQKFGKCQESILASLALCIIKQYRLLFFHGGLGILQVCANVQFLAGFCRVTTILESIFPFKILMM